MDLQEAQSVGSRGKGVAEFCKQAEGLGSSPPPVADRRSISVASRHSTTSCCMQSCNAVAILDLSCTGAKIPILSPVAS